MKKLLLLLFSLLISFNSYGKTVCVETDDVQKRDGTYYLVNQEKPFTGNNSCQYLSNGQQHSKGKIKKGKKNGKWIQWYENGQIESETIFKSGKRKKWIEWFENGQIESERNYNPPGTLDGKLNLWYENGQKESEVNYKDGKWHGKRAEWYENGHQKEESYYIQGLLYGIRIQWYENGQMHYLDEYNECGEQVHFETWKMNGEKVANRGKERTCTEDDIKIAIKKHEIDSEEGIKRIYQNLLNRPNYETNFQGWVDKYGYK